MSTSNLFFKGCFSELTKGQKAAIEEICAEGNLKDKSCSREVNTCGMTLQQLLDAYEFYNDQKGLYRSWGDIYFPWEIKTSTTNLDYVNTNDKWSVSVYKELISYAIGDRVLYIENDGYLISLYEAVENIPSITGPFDHSKWSKICSIELPEPFGLPTIPELLERYNYYTISLFFEEWEEFSSEWERKLFQESKEACDIEDGVRKIPKKDLDCLADNSVDVWKDARIRKEYFYREGDYAIVNSDCKDTVCLYLNVRSLPADKENFDIFKTFSLYYDFKGTWSSDGAVITVNQPGHPYKQYDTIKVAILNTTTHQPASNIEDHSIIFVDYLVDSVIDGDNFTYIVPVSLDNIEPFNYTINIKQFGPFWEKIYCVGTGRNKCLEYERKNNLSNYEVVPIGSQGHFVEKPIPYSLAPKEQTLNEITEQLPLPKILSQKEIDALEN